MEVSYFYGDHWWARAHASGCSKLGREVRDESAQGTYMVEVASARELIEEVASDFIFLNNHQPWTDYIGQVSLAPCLGDLPSQS